ncbi:MAG: anti-sigma factor [Acidobacteria bacterium]|nr:anti-sigma factor [Acidobacteriota bacterium]
MKRHRIEEIHELLDGRLDPGRRAEVELHLSECEPCRKRHEALIWTRKVAAGHLCTARLPAELESQVRNVLDAEDRIKVCAGSLLHRWGWAAGLSALAAALLVALGLPLLRTSGRADLPALVAGDHDALKAGSIQEIFRTTDTASLEAYFRAQGVDFTTRVFDLGMMGYRLSGGRAHRLAGRTSALFAYRGPAGEWLVCQMLVGTLAELPDAAEERQHDGIRFLAYASGDVTTVFWQEGDVICALSSAGSPEELWQLAFAKAVRI